MGIQQLGRNKADGGRGTSSFAVQTSSFYCRHAQKRQCELLTILVTELPNPHASAATLLAEFEERIMARIKETLATHFINISMSTPDR
jgi:hypothetical protein